VFAGFAALLPEGFELPADVEERIAEGIADRRLHLVLGELEGEPRGYAGFGPSRDPEAPGAVGELRSLFVHPSAWWRGLGRALVADVLERLGADGCSEVTVWSFADNERANAFYEDHSFARDGAARRQAEWADLPQVRYRRAL
jgi:GNAT superfamily N-acetyltransferase